MGHYNRVKLQGLSLLLMLTIPSATIYWQQAELTQGLIPSSALASDAQSLLKVYMLPLLTSTQNLHMNVYS